MPAPFLKGTRVLDLSQYIPGPYASLMLADLGADVLKVEPPGGDPMRHIGPAGVAGASAYYALFNGGKRVVRIDLKSREGRDALLALVGEADVLIESYRPGVLDRLGLGRDTLAAANPVLVHCAITNYGQTGPLAGKAAHDLNCMALGGGLAASGIAERPVMTLPPIADFASALQASTSILAALVARGRGEGGCYIDLAMTDTVLAWQSCLLTEAARRDPGPLRARLADNGGSASYNIYETSDGRFVTIAADEEKFWANFCRAVGRPDWIPRKAEPPPQADLIAQVQGLIGSRDLRHWNALLGGVDCCCEAVLEPSEVAGHPQVLARALVHGSDIGGPADEVLYPAWIDGAPPQPRSRHLEIDTAEALRTWANRAG